MQAPTFIAKFDSSAAMLKATANFLCGEDFPGLGIVHSQSDLLTCFLDIVPKKILSQAYIWGGWREGVLPDRLGNIDPEKASIWTLSQFPRQKYPAIAIGSSNGALVHLWSALKIPWIPQTYLIPVRRSGVNPDEPVQDFEWGKQHAVSFLAANPDLQINQALDPSDDRLMSRRIAYFRIKKLKLGEIYRQFIVDSLCEGGTIFIVDCQKKWKTTKVSERHYFQFGGEGGATQEEFLHGSMRVEQFLKNYHSPFKKWNPPQPDTISPEAEWGYEPALTEDIIRLAREMGYRIIRIEFENPMDISPFVSDLYIWWNKKRGIKEKRLFIESFILLDPWWTIKTGSIPFWTVFNQEKSLNTAKKYIDEIRSFDEIYLTLFSNGIKSIGFRPIEDWKNLIQRAKKRGEFIGVNEETFPSDFSVFIRYYTDLKKKINARYPTPDPLTITDLETFISQNTGMYKVEWSEL